jgi:hypothetical protein
MFPSRRFSPEIGRQGKKYVISETFPANFLKFIFVLYGLLKMPADLLRNF